jgi:DNA replication protein DnaC
MKLSELVQAKWKDEQEIHWTEYSEEQKKEIQRIEETKEIMAMVQAMNINQTKRYFYYDILPKYWPEKFKITAEQEHAMRVIFDWIHGIEGDYRDIPNKKNIPYDLNKGWLIIGGPGTGKSTLMEAFSELTHLKQMRKFTMLYCDRDSAAATKEKKTELPSKYFRGERCLDELGHEKGKAKIWGNETDFIGDVLHERHRIRAITHATTNIDIDKDEPVNLFDIYGYRIHSRLNQMFNVIYLNGRDWRIKTIDNIGVSPFKK